MRVSKYTDQFRADAVALCERGDRSLREVASDLGVNHWTLRDWVRQSTMERRSKSKNSAEQSAPVNETFEEKAKRLEKEVERLRKVNERLEQDREILKKAATFFAKESE